MFLGMLLPPFSEAVKAIIYSEDLIHVYHTVRFRITGDLNTNEV